MIKKMEIRGVHMHVDPKLYTYATKKIGKLDSYVSRHVRESLHAEVILKEEVLKTKKKLHLRSHSTPSEGHNNDQRVYC